MCEILVFEKVVWQLIARKKRLVKQHSKSLLSDYYFPPMKFKFNMKEGFEIIGALSYSSIFRLLQVPWTILNRLHSKFINLFFSFLFFSIFYLFIHFPLSSSSLSRSSFFFFFNNFNNHQRRLRKQCINRITVLITPLCRPIGHRVQ